MPIPLGILAAAGFRPSAAGSFDLLETTVLTGSQASVEFTNLTTKYASSYQHLQIRSVARTTQTGSSGIGTLYIRLNSDTGTNYSRHFLYGDSVLSTPGSFGEANTNHMPGHLYANADFATSAFGAGVVDLLDPFETSKNTTIRSIGGIAPKQVSMTSGAWRNTASVTTITISPENFTGNFVTGSRFSLYGLKAA